MELSGGQVHQDILAATVISPDDLPIGNTGMIWRCLTLPNHVLPEEKQITHSIVVHGSLMLVYSGNALYHICQVHLLLTGELGDRCSAQRLIEGSDYFSKVGFNFLVNTTIACIIA